MAFVLFQVIASTVKNFLLLDLGLSIAFPTIVIPALTGLNDQVNPNETIHMTAAQASWLGEHHRLSIRTYCFMLAFYVFLFFREHRIFIQIDWIDSIRMDM